jgi:exopolyphosphatase/guanosine-5'-triphosphate,3'-diphosphate pyrophosphatase
MAKDSRRTRRDDAAITTDAPGLPDASVGSTATPSKGAKPSKTAKVPKGGKTAKVPKGGKTAKVPKGDKAAKVARAPKGRKAAKDTKDAKAPKRGKGSKPGKERWSARGVLAEVAALVRQAAEPAADRILRAVAARSLHEAAPAFALEPEGVAASAPEPEPEPEPDAAPEPASAPASAPESTPEATTTPVPEPPVSIVPIPGVAVGASVDVGANSVHLLVAAVGGHQLQPLVDESVFLGLGDRIDRQGYLGAAARGELVAALVGYADAARRLGATEITFVGTEPMRRATDAATVTYEVERHAGVPFHVLGHDEEGVLTLIGVTAGQPVSHELVVVDVGGGSSEIVIVGPGRAPVAAGLALGSARLTQRLVRADPPTQAEINALHAEARRAVADAPQAAPEELVAVGGTVSNLLKVIPAAALERVLTRRRITVALAMLATEPSAQASQRHAVNPTRARILPAGAVIVDALLEHYGLEQLRVSEDGIREGAILVAAHAGRAWRDRLPELALGWREPWEAGPG